jgi:hypothetical protein
MIYDVDYFINKFEAITEEKWAILTFQSYDGKRCALGHCFSERTLVKLNNAGVENGTTLYKPTAEEFATEFKESHSLCLHLCPDSANKGSEMVIQINNGDDPRYQQKNPKQRIIAALYDIRKLQTKDTDTDTKKERIVYVSVPVSITEQARELITN